MSNAISAQGTILARQAGGSGAFTDIANLMDITPPPLMRNAIETTAHNDTEEAFIVGIFRKGEMTFTIGFTPSGATHNATAGLQYSIKNGVKDGWRITFPDTTTWIFSGYVTNIGPTAPVDDMLAAEVTIRPTGTMAITP
jgi:hypothetical protein